MWSENDTVTTPHGTGRVLKVVGGRVRVQCAGTPRWLETKDVTPTDGGLDLADNAVDVSDVKSNVPEKTHVRARRTWFSELFGFDDEGGVYEEHRARFQLDGEWLVCDGAPFPRQHVGPWEAPSVAELRLRWSAAAKSDGTGKLTFRHLAAGLGVEPLLSNPSNAGAVFMVASQFNALEMISPERTPRHGVSIYVRDKTQGPVCAMACPAATIFRNYLVEPVDLLFDVGDVLGNGTGTLWQMKNGYALPTSADSFRGLSRRLASDPELCAAAEGALRVGVHADAQVRPPLTHTVAQVFCSALPVAYARGHGLEESDWEPFARLVLRGAYDATLAFAACKAATTGKRVAVYLTAIGDGAFGNATSWVRESLEAALGTYRDAALDVTLVHYGTTVGERWVGAGLAGDGPARVDVDDPAQGARAAFAKNDLLSALKNKRGPMDEE